MNDIKDKTAYLAELKAGNPEQFMRVVRDNLTNNPAFRRKTDAVGMERIIGRGDWSYIVYNIPLDVPGQGKAVLTDDLDDARQTYNGMNRKGIGSLVMLIHVSPQMAELLQEAHDIEDIMNVIDGRRSEYKVLLCNKSVDWT